MVQENELTKDVNANNNDNQKAEELTTGGAEPEQKSVGKKIKDILYYIFIDGLSGMAIGLFATLIIGTIIDTIGGFIPGFIGNVLKGIGTFAKLLMGAGIGLGMAYKLKKSPLVSICAGVTGTIGAYAVGLLEGNFGITKVGEPLGAFIAAFVTLEVGSLVSNKTKVDIIVTPLVSILSGAIVALLLAYPIKYTMEGIQYIIRVSAEQQPYLMAILVAVIMGICLTLPISSAAIGVALKLGGELGAEVGTIIAGAAVAGCCAHMVGFAVMSFRENKWSGLIAQGIGTSMLQMPNLIKKPILWVPPIIASIIVGPISVALGMTCNTVGAGMGTSGLVGCFGTFTSMFNAGVGIWSIIWRIGLVHIILPAAICLIVSEIFRKFSVIKFGDLKLDL